MEKLTKNMQDNYRYLIGGMLFILIALAAPIFFKYEHYGILAVVVESIDAGSVIKLVGAAAWLVAISTICALPIYLGPLFLAEGLGTFKRGSPWWIRWTLILLIPCIYESAYQLHDVTYDFGVPAITMTLAILVITKMQTLARSIFHKSIVVLLLLFGVEWLDIVPLLTPFHFGRGSLADLIKTTSYLNHASEAFNVLGISICLFCVANAFLLAWFLNLYTLQILAVEQKLALEKMSHQIDMQRLENRSYKEMRALVHDLKTPLTSIQGLAGVISISSDPGIMRQHADYISKMVDKMNIMVDELLHDDSRQLIQAADLVRYAAAHVPELNEPESCRFELDLQADPWLKVNKIRFSRVLINILQNALEAVEKDKGAVKLTVIQQNQEAVFSIEDNGKGFTGVLENIWKVGYSQKNSSGLGLPFVHDMVLKYGGTVRAENRREGGARVIIRMPAVQGGKLDDEEK